MQYRRGAERYCRSIIRGDSKRTSGFFLFDKEKFIEKLGL